MGIHILPSRRGCATLLMVLAAAAGCGGADAPLATPRSMAIELSAPSAAVQPGEAATVALTLVRRGVSGDITPSIEGLPPGVDASFSPAAYSGDIDRLIITINAAPSVAVGTHVVVVRARGAGAEAQTPLTLAIRATGGSTNFVALSFCPEDVPYWLAYQNEGEQWVRALPGSEGSFTFQGSNRIGLAWVHVTPAGPTLTVVYTTVAELTPRNGMPCMPATGGSSFTGTFANLGSSIGVVSMSHAFDYNQSAAMVPRFALTNLPERPLDMVAMRADVNRKADAIPNRVMIRRRINPLSTPTTSVDFGTDEAMTPVSAPLLVENLGADTLVLHVTYRTANGTEGPLQHLTTAAADPPIFGVPTVLQAPTDAHVVAALAVGPATSMRGAYLYEHALATARVALGSDLEPPSLALEDSLPYARWRVQLPAQASYGRAVVASFVQSARVVTMLVTAGYARGAALWDLTLPRLDAAEGWSSDWGLVAGSPGEWMVTALSGTSLIFGGTPASGTVELHASRWGALPATTPGSIAALGDRIAAARLRASPAIAAPLVP